MNHSPDTLKKNGQTNLMLNISMMAVRT